jgi:bidirectional [NiFe] hydrogenase diaphorase subunit
MENVTMKINGMPVQVPEGTTILRAAKEASVKIPTLCHDDNLEPYGACRLCMVEVEKGGRKKLVASCLCQAEDGLIVRTETERVRRIRKMMM